MTRMSRYSTLCELAGVDATDWRAAAAGLPAIDSISLVPVLLPHELSGANTTPRTSLVLATEPTDGFRNGSTVGGFLQQESDGSLWKIILGTWDQATWVGKAFPNQTTNWVPQDFVANCSSSTSDKRACLFRVDEAGDPTEHHDLGAEPLQQDRITSLIAKVVAASQTAFNPWRGKLDPRACAVATGQYRGYWGPFAQ
jgi:arylsulfatase B